MLFCGSRILFPWIYTQSTSHIYCRSLFLWSHGLGVPRVKGVFKNKMEICRFWYIDFTNKHNSSTSCTLILCCALSLWVHISHVACIVQWDIRRNDKAEAWWVPVHSHLPFLVSLCSLVSSPGDTWLHHHAAKPTVSRPLNMCVSLVNTRRATLPSPI